MVPPVLVTVEAPRTAKLAAAPRTRGACALGATSQLGFHPKPCGLLNVQGYYAPLLALFDHGVAEGFIRPQHRALVLEETAPAALLARMEAFVPPTGDKWIGREER